MRGLKIKPVLAFLISAVLFTGSCSWAEFKIADGENALMSVHFIDVGQGDCVLAVLPDGKTVLIDSGGEEYAGDVINYLSACIAGNKIDYIIATHPHEDHIGALAEIISRFEAGVIYMPPVNEELVDETGAFRDLLDAAEYGGKEIVPAKAGSVLFDFAFDSKNVRAEFLAPVREYDSVNNSSAVLKLTFGRVSFLFTGDIESESENDLLNSPEKLNSDVLKVPHHGSGTSSGFDFINAVSPEYAVISCAINNIYGHPDAGTLENLRGAEISRTDEDGTVVFKTDGTNCDKALTAQK